jgi:hypothetical protein
MHDFIGRAQTIPLHEMLRTGVVSSACTKPAVEAKHCSTLFMKHVLP